MRFLALFAVVSPALNSAQEDWTTWDDCSDGVSNPPTPPAGSQPIPGISFSSLEEIHQIVTMDADNGELTVNNQATLWERLKGETDQVRMIFPFSGPRLGKSVLASFLGCSLQGPLADHFPTHGPTGGTPMGGRTLTEGIWASNPFSIPGVTGKYIIMDMMSHDSPDKFQGKLSYTRKNDNIIKLLALMSEVVSTFIFITNTQDVTPSVSDFNFLGLAMSETRQNMVLSSNDPGTDNSAAPISQDIDLRSHNNPKLIIVSRSSAHALDTVKSNEWAVNTTELHQRASNAKNLLQGDATGQELYGLFTRNFDPIVNGDEGEIPWLFAYLPDLTESGNDGNHFLWTQNPAYSYSAGGHCKAYNRMNDSLWRCRRDVSLPTDPARYTPSRPGFYRLSIDYIAETLKTEAPVRRLSWKGQENPTALTLDRINVILQQGVTEMNAIGPLPRSELWRRIMDDRCKGEIVEYLDYTYGESSGVYPAGGNYTTGILREISNGLVELGSGRIPELEQMRARWAELEKKWTSKKEIDLALNEWFVNHPLLQSVRTTCEAEGTQHKELLDQTFATRVSEWTAILANKRRALAEEALRQALETSWWRQFWEEWRLYIIIGAVVMIPVLLIFCRLWRMVNGTCRACASCCGDWGDTSTTTKIVTVGAGGGSSSRNAPVERGPAVPFASALAVPAGGSAPGSSSEDPNARIEKISNTIKELQKRASR